MSRVLGSDEYKQLSCPICLEAFESPKVLTCLHTFCEKCICKHVHCLREEGIHSDTINCPVCRTCNPAPIFDQTPDHWAANLPASSIDLSRSISDNSRKNDPVFCQPCLSDHVEQIATAYCVTCQEYVCQSCYTCHKKFKATKDHTVTLQSMPENQQLQTNKDRLFRCSKHQKKYTYFCQNDKDICCSKCAFADHRSCTDLFLIDDQARNFKECSEAKKVLEKLDLLRKMFVILLENRTKVFDSVKQQNLDITQEIKEWAKEVRNEADKLERDALEELELVYKQEAVSLSNQIIQCKSTIAAIETSERVELEGMKTDENKQLFMTTTRISQQAKKYFQTYDAAHDTFRDIQFKFERDKNLEGLLKTLRSIGRVLNESSQIQELSSDVSYERAILLLPRAQPNSIMAFNAKVPDDEETCNIYSGIFLPGNRFVVCDEQNKKLKLFEKCYHCVSYLKLTHTPRFICSVDTTTVAVTTAGSVVEIVSVVNTLTKLRSISVGRDCFGIGSCQGKIMVVIHEEEQASLILYNKSFKIFRRIQLPKRSSSSYNSLCVSQDGNTILYTVEDNIVVVDMDGQILNTYVSSNLKCALGIILDKNGNIYCCGKESKTVVHVHIIPKREQMSVLLSHDNGLENPLGICLNCADNVIHVFEEQSNEVKNVQTYTMSRFYYHSPIEDNF